MKNTITNICMFAMGVSIGSIVTYKLIDKKYEAKIQEEIASIKKSFANRPTTINIIGNANEEALSPYEDQGTGEVDEIKKAKDKKKAEKLVTKQGYTNYSEYSKSADIASDEQPIMAEQPGDMDRPYYYNGPVMEFDRVISTHVLIPEEFGELDNYEQISLTYFADGILASENNEPIDDVDNIVGLESLEHFGEYEDDSVFVRNDKLKSDYEILKDNRRWEDVVNPPKQPKARKTTAYKKPHQMEE